MLFRSVTDTIKRLGINGAAETEATGNGGGFIRVGAGKTPSKDNKLENQRTGVKGIFAKHMKTTALSKNINPSTVNNIQNKPVTVLTKIHGQKNPRNILGDSVGLSRNKQQTANIELKKKNNLQTKNSIALDSSLSKKPPQQKSQPKSSVVGKTMPKNNAPKNDSKYGIKQPVKIVPEKVRNNIKDTTKKPRNNIYRS